MQDWIKGFVRHGWSLPGPAAAARCRTDDIRRGNIWETGCATCDRGLHFRGPYNGAKALPRMQSLQV